MLDDQSNHFGIDLAQNTRRFLRTPCIDLLMALPYFEEQLNVPTNLE